jgi:hypothetical protein
LVFSTSVIEAKRARLLKPRALTVRNYFITRDHRSASAANPGKSTQLREYRSSEQGLSAGRALKRGGYDTETSMIDFKRVGMAAILSAAMALPSLTQAMAQGPLAYASNETATRPWSAPVGHRQPRSADIPASTSASQQIIDQEDVIVDRKIKGVCRGC